MSSDRKNRELTLEVLVEIIDKYPHAEVISAIGEPLVAKTTADNGNVRTIEFVGAVTPNIPVNESEA